MKTDFEKEFEKVMTEEKEMPVKVRQSLDTTYELIRIRSKKKKSRFIWKRVAAAACALLITGAALSNEQVRAGVTDFFNFGDKGIEKAVTEGFVQDNNSTATDQNITVKLTQHFSDANKLGMSFQLAFENPALLENGVTEVSMDYRLKNGDGEYILEFIPDTKTLKGNGRYVSSGVEHNSILDVKTGKVQYDIIINSNKGELPILKDAVVEIESINVFRGSEYADLKKIDGKWDLAVANQDESKPISTIEYVMADPSSIIQVASAKASPTSFNLAFTMNQVFKDESPFVHTMKIIDGEGNEHNSDGFSIETKDNQTHISINFPITSFDDVDKLKFIVEDIGEVELLKK